MRAGEGLPELQTSERRIAVEKPAPCGSAPFGRAIVKVVASPAQPPAGVLLMAAKVKEPVAAQLAARQLVFDTLVAA